MLFRSDTQCAATPSSMTNHLVVDLVMGPGCLVRPDFLSEGASLPVHPDRLNVHAEKENVLVSCVDSNRRRESCGDECGDSVDQHSLTKRAAQRFHVIGCRVMIHASHASQAALA